MKPPAGVREALPEMWKLNTVGTNEPGTARAAHATGFGQNHVSKCEACAVAVPILVATSAPAAPVARLMYAYALFTGSKGTEVMMLVPLRNPVSNTEIAGTHTLPHTRGSLTELKAAASALAPFGKSSATLAITNHR